jgi:hypothetical protein
VGMHRENQFIGVQRPGLGNKSDPKHKNKIRARERLKIIHIQRAHDQSTYHYISALQTREHTLFINDQSQN